jgi:holin-like protein
MTMTGLQGLVALLLCQSLGELLARGTAVPLPGPVLGMLLCLALLQWPAARPVVGTAAEPLLQHLSLLFVPVGVGVIAHLDRVAAHGLPMLVALLVSTLCGLAVTAFVLQWLLARADGGAQAASSVGEGR